MSIDTLPDQLRAVVDAVDTPSFAEIRSYHAPSHARSPRTRVAIALAAVLIVVAIGVGLVALLRDDTAGRGHNAPAAIPTECTTRDGCAMTAAEASRILGFAVPEPATLPDGWVSLGARLRVFEGVPLYVRVWGPAGTDLGAPEVCAPHVLTRVRPALPGEDPSQIGNPYPLGNGTTAYGEAPDVGCYHGSLGWVRDGRSVVLEGTNMTLDQLVTIARSLDGRVDTVPAKCIVTLSNYAGCKMTAKRAQQYLGFRPRVATDIPEGWVQQPSRLKILRSQSDPASATGVTDVAEFFQYWAPPGTPAVADRPANNTCTPVLVVRQRMELVAEGDGQVAQPTVELGDGRVAIGTLGPTACLPGDPTAPSGDLFWSDQGRSYGVTGNDIPNEQFLAIARSLDR